MINHGLFNSLIVIPILNVLVAFYKLFLLLKIPGAFGFAIIALTVFVRLILHPLFKQQVEMGKKMNDIKPHLDRLNIKHKNDQKKLQEEQLKLYQQAGINPAGGCLTLIIQMPLFIGLYQTLSLFFGADMAKVIASINGVLYTPLLKITTIDPWFFWFNLAKTPEQAKLWWYYSIPLITGILQFFQAQVMQPATQNVPKNEKNAVKQEKGDKKESASGDFQNAMNTQMKYIFPFMIAWFSLRLPVGLSLYWNIFSLFSIIQYKQGNKKKTSLTVTK